MDSIRSQLMDMGFDESKVKRAIDSCPEAQTLEQVMEWLIAHEDELNTPGASTKTTTTPNTNTTKPKEINTTPDAAKTPTQQAQDNSQANGTGGAAGGESGETVANMAARKKITVEEAQRIISERLAIRAEEERKKAIEDEKNRRLAGQKMAQTRQELQDLERIRLAQQIRREKLEKEAHRKQVLDQIARDREAMRNRAALLKPTEPAAASAHKQTSSSDASKQQSTTTTTTTSKTAATECRLALRFPDGTNLVHKFSPQEQLSAVRLFVQVEKAGRYEMGNIEFVAPPNRKLTESSMDNTLEHLGLCPASRLEVKFNQVHIADLD